MNDYSRQVACVRSCSVWIYGPRLRSYFLAVWMVCGCVCAGSVEGNAPDIAREDAVVLAREGAPEKALAILENLLKEHPEDSRLLADTLIVANWAGEDAKVVRLFRRADSLRSDTGVVEAAARSYRNLGDSAQAVRLFRLASELEPERWQASLGLALSLVEMGREKEARPILEKLPALHPAEREVIVGVAYGYRALEEPAQAIGLYQDWLGRRPEDSEVRDSLALTLSQIWGAWRAQQSSVTDPLTQVEVSSRLAAEQIRWGQSYAPTRALQRAESELAREQIAQTLELIDDGEFCGPEKDRVEWLARQSVYDRMIVLRDLREMTEVLEEYALLEEPPPLHVDEAAADAWLALKQPEKAEPLYRKVVEENPGYGEAWIGLAYAQLESEKVRAAVATLDEAVSKSPAWLAGPGLRTPKMNQDRKTLEVQRALMHAYAEDLPEAQRLLEAMRHEAPGSIRIRQALAQVYGSRGWLNRAREELLIAKTYEPGDDGLILGLAEMQDALAQRDAVDAVLPGLQEREPDSQRLQSMIRKRGINHGWKASVDYLRGWGDGPQVGSHDDFVDAWLQAPWISNRWRLFAHGMYANADFSGGWSDRWRLGGGVRYEYDRKAFWMEFSYDGGSAGDRPAVNGGMEWAWGDHWVLTAGASSNSWNVPMQAALSGIHGPGGELSLLWRAHERRSASVGFAQTSFSDGNQRSQVSANWSERVFTSPHLKVNGQLLAYTSYNSLENASYFNPRNDFEIGPRVEVDWLTWRRYDFEFHQYLQLYAGAYWQSDFGAGPAFAARYGQRWQLRYGTVITWGISWSRHPYDGQTEDRLAIDFGMEWGWK